MNDERPTDLLSSLPRTRPHRRSEKRGAAPGGRKAPATEPSGAETKPAAGPKPAAETAGPKPAAETKPAAGSKPGPTRAARAKAKPARTGTAARKSARRAADTRMRQPAQPRGIPSARRAPKRKPAPTTGTEIVGTAVQAVGELAEIGVALGARALRNALGRLPRP